MSPGELHAWSCAARGWVRRSFLVFSSYAFMAVWKIELKLEEGEDVNVDTVSDIGRVIWMSWSEKIEEQENRLGQRGNGVPHACRTDAEKAIARVSSSLASASAIFLLSCLVIPCAILNLQHYVMFFL